MLKPDGQELASSPPGATPFAEVDGVEAELLINFTKGDPLAFATIVRRYQAPLYGYLCRCGVPPSYRDDLFQEILLKVNRNTDRFDPSRPLKPWLFTIAITSVRSHFRKTRIDIAPLEDEHAAEQPTSDELVAARETEDWIAQSIAELPIAQREVMVLVCVMRMDRLDVARTLDTPLETVKTLLRRGRLTLAKRPCDLDPSGGNRQCGLYNALYR